MKRRGRALKRRYGHTQRTPCASRNVMVKTKIEGLENRLATASADALRGIRAIEEDVDWLLAHCASKT